MGHGGDELSLTPGQKLTIVESTPERLVVEAVYAPGGSPPPPHFHPDQDEHFEILEGTLQAIVGDESSELNAGDELDVRSGTVHRMWNGASGEVRVRWVTEPGGRTEEWFRAIDALHRRNAEGDVEPQEFVDLLNSYGDVIRIVMPGADGRGA